MQTYFVKSIETSELILDGRLSDSLWDKANIITEFKSPWDNEQIARIEFRSLYSKSKLYFSFKVFDSKIHLINDDDSNASINDSDRVELFFRSDLKMSPYYCLEIDPIPRIMDFKALPNKQFDFEWSWPSGELEVKSNIATDHFIVEGSISLTSLTELGLLNENRIETGIFRAKYNSDSNGSFVPTWITWVDPSTNEPNFHTSSSFGVLHLQ